MSISFRHSAGFGKRIEYYLIGLMLKEGIDVYVPLVDDNAIDAIIKKADGSYIEIQIKARSLDIKLGDAALFSAITHKDRKNYYFVFYSERLKKTWIMSSKEFIEEAVLNKSGQNIGKRSIKFNGFKTDKVTKERIEYAKPKYDKYLVDDFSKFY
ncbi:hypothetical protein [Paenibacillus sp. QZ-Y1]|uniref:hypothetical protein n=1 Tax=Paenibacillus sp. QZ-Y1 TaxID=3414511 RepID=UPI003F792C26